MSIIFNSITPAALAGGKNITWQVDGSGNLSGYTSGAGSRQSVLFNTQSLAAGAKQDQSSGFALTLAKSFILFSVTTTRPARVQLYQTAAQQVADTARPNTTPPTAGAPNGVILDLYLDATTWGTYPDFFLSPPALGVNLEGSPAATIAYQITNLDSVTGVVGVTFNFLALE